MLNLSIQAANARLPVINHGALQALHYSLWSTCYFFLLFFSQSPMPEHRLTIHLFTM